MYVYTHNTYNTNLLHCILLEKLFAPLITLHIKIYSPLSYVYWTCTVTKSPTWVVIPNVQAGQLTTHLGSGHLPLSRSSSTYLRTTSWHRWSRDNTASFVIEPSLLSDFLLTNENWRRVSKQVFAKSSRSLRLDSVSASKQVIEICGYLSDVNREI